MVRKVRGFTLIEFIVVIAILAILLGIGLNRYGAWKKNIEVESDVRKLYSTIQEARMKAFADKEDIDVVVNGTDVEVENGSTILTKLKLKNPFGNKTIEINPKGLFVDSLNVTCTTPNVNPDYNCVVVSRYRIRLGYCQ